MTQLRRQAERNAVYSLLSRQRRRYGHSYISLMNDGVGKHTSAGSDKFILPSRFDRYYAGLYACIRFAVRGK